MMKEETARKIEALREKVNNGYFTKKDAKGIVSITTLRKYDLIESVEVETAREEITIDELIKDVNEMIGEDCYGMEGYYERVDDKIFYVLKEWGYRFKR